MPEKYKEILCLCLSFVFTVDDENSTYLFKHIK